MEDERGFTNRYIEKQTRCDICYHNKMNFFHVIYAFFYMSYMF